MKKINIIITELKNLTLLEVNDLIKEIEKTFNIDSSISMPTTISNIITSSSIETNKDISPKEEKTSFTILLNEVPTANKIAILKVVRNITGLGLKESKEIIDNVPKIIKENIEKDECDRLKKDLETAGAKVVIK